MMERIEKNKIQPLLLSMLKALKEYFDNNEIGYFLAGGTLLGAVRHKGFIPWDDDIDIFLKFEEFEKLLDLARYNPYIDSENRYKLLCPSTYENIYPFIKLVDTRTVIYENNYSKKYASGIYIDIFSMSYWPDDYDESLKLLKKQNIYKKMLMITASGNLKKRKYKILFPFILPIKFALNIFGLNPQYWSKKLYQLGCGEKSNYIGNLSWTSGMKERYDTLFYSECDYLQFEDQKYPVPIKYDCVLKKFYGDYMQLPPENKRVMHGFEAYYVD